MYCNDEEVTLTYLTRHFYYLFHGVSKTHVPKTAACQMPAKILKTREYFTLILYRVLIVCVYVGGRGGEGSLKKLSSNFFKAFALVLRESSP